MKKLFYMLIAALVSQMLLGCSKNGSSANPPSAFAATAGDNRVVVTWTAEPTVDYWLFAATDPSLTAFVWASLPDSHLYMSAASPFYMCGLLDGTEYWYAINGRIDGGPGGPSSPTISATPYKAGSAWNTVTLSPPDLFHGVGYAGLTTCSNIATSAAGSFATVGASGVIATSPDGATWTSQTAPAGFTSDLYAVTGYAANQNNPGDPGLRWIAVGAGGASIYSTDGVTWVAGNAANSSSTANPSNYSLRSVIHVGSTYFAVGDGGTVLLTTNGTDWTPPLSGSGTTSNLYGITYGGTYVAVGDGGTILTSSDGTNWTAMVSVTTNTLRQVTSIGTTYVAVGDNGTIATSVDSGETWTAQTLAGAPNLVGIAANAQVAAYNSHGAAFSATDLATNSLFVSIDSSGNAYTSTDGLTWSGATATGATGLNSLVSSGFGYVATGASGVIATSF